MLSELCDNSDTYIVSQLPVYYKDAERICNMELLYHSTRDSRIKAASSEAILQGLSSDGGLFVPERIPALELPLDRLPDLSYQETAYEIMRLFFTDFSEEELRSCIQHAYDDKFDIPEIAGMRQTGNVWYLELFHGKTIAFKDMALSILPHLMTTAAAKLHVKDRIVILTATSGDTGKAALAGFADVPGTSIIVFYPKHGVSSIQELQMITQTGDNTHVIGIEGNFDEAQTGVKRIFSDEELRERLKKAGYRFSSANSINIGRLVPQIVYYVYAYGQLVKKGALRAGDHMNVTVPTGNFGNILAAYYAKKMGLPIRNLICASNQNKVLTDFFRTGQYDRNRPFFLSSSPSMDILISSNLERLLYHIADEDTEIVKECMKGLSEEGRYRITEKMAAALNGFFGDYASEEETAEEIRRVYHDWGYVIDPHTAVASSVYRKYMLVTKDPAVTVIASTASPFKFTGSVMKALGEKTEDQNDFELADMLSKISGTPIPAAVAQLKDAPVLHRTVIDKGDMKQAVTDWLESKGGEL